MSSILLKWADIILLPHSVTVAIVIMFFIVPLMRLFTFPFAAKHRTALAISGVFGRLERFIGPIRDYIVPAYLAAAAGWNIYRDNFYVAAGAVLLSALNEAHRIWKQRSIRTLLEFAKRNPDTHPAEFFDYLYASYGCIKPALAEKPEKKIDHLGFDFRNSRNGQKTTIWPAIRASLNMMAITRLILKAAKWKGSDYAKEVASGLAAIYSARVCQLAQVKLTVEGYEKLKNVNMPFIYLPNHTSAFDFNLLPTLSAAHRKVANTEISLVPRFLLARDHFLDNILLQRIIGVGRVAEILQMVFVERGKHGRAKTKQMVNEAVEKLLVEAMPLAVYPQGSRARSKTSLTGERLDGGYYTVGSKSRLKRDGGHLKKGAAFIAVDSAHRLATAGKDERLSLVPVAIVGAAIVLPRRSLKVLRGQNVVLRVGDPIVIEPREAAHLAPEEASAGYQEFVITLHNRIDRSLKTTFRVHAELERRFFEDLRQTSDPHKLEELSIAMKQWRGEDYIVFVILDFIYTCKPKVWRQLLGQLVHLILTDAPRKDFTAFRDRIADMIPR